ncbi:hypothetical protein Q31b_52700 [Novipirellula aureliae]|uniref:Uncharacterized protein n=1 Tax=Novipirellula aureliae TaxID=2527966 RepID=A0A5C6DI13_9BACT|nr:hypothetical protein [Novipirellula aureliae]TWU35835.1 hypothetical protein Q31b_52700 [Novipirellula aureliae]
MTLEADIIERIRADFPDAGTALAAMSVSGKTGRIARCIVFASNGSLEKMREYIQMAETDFRDVIVAGEYDETMRPVRDLCVSFLIASPDDFWIAETAKSIYKRGYSLTAVKSGPATVGPFDYTCDRSEGTATFSSDVHEIEIEKADRKWSVNSDDDLRRFGLDESLDDEERFRIQLDLYLSQK